LWRVRLERLGNGDAPMERKVSAAAIGALPNWPFLGVSVACLRAFAHAHEALLVDATTEDVCERVCKPLTETAGDSLSACLVRLGAADPATGVPFAAAPTIFVSHARKYLFRDLVEAVCAHVSSLPEEEHERHYVWLDIFSQYQHWIGDVGTAQRPCNWDVVFQLTTAAIGHTCLVFAPWRDAVPLRRAWMLWEVLCTLTARGRKGATSSALRVRLPPAESDDFQAALVNEFDVIAASVARIDSRSAECFTREDQAMVHAAIDRTLKGGHTELDALLSEALREWLAAEGRAALMRMPREERATSALQNQLGLLLQDQGKRDEAEQLYREALEARRATLGDRHPHKLASINNLGLLLKDQGKLDEAEPLLREALEARRATLGDRHPDTLGSINNLGSLLKNQGKLDEALLLYREALEARRATLGDRHPRTLASMTNLGLLLLMDQSKLNEAEPLLREALEVNRATLGDRHPDTLGSIKNLAALLYGQGKHDEAEPLGREVFEAQRATLGDRHPHTLGSMNNLGSLLEKQGKLDEAEPLLREALKAMRTTLGDRHPDTLVSIKSLASLLVEQEKVLEALSLMLEHSRATLGDRHPTTLQFTNQLRALVGEQVLVHGLVAKPELNNRTGTATGWDSERGRFAVLLQDGSTVALKPANLREP
jgi:tetratricopeptide (TPR) repeat protein